MDTLNRELSLQLYSLRNELAKDYEGTMRKVAEFGYKFVEPAGFPGSNIQEASKLYESLGLRALSMHGALPLGNDKNRAIEEAQMLGAKYIITGKSAADFTSADDAKKIAEIFTKASQNAAEHNLKVAYHNHNWEMKEFDGVPAYRIFMNHTPKSVIMELDTYWIKVGGLDPVTLIKEVAERAALIHIKDGAIEPAKPMLAVGHGDMNFPPIIEAANFAELLIVELDECATDMLEAIEQSYNYLNNNRIQMLENVDLVLNME